MRKHVMPWLLQWNYRGFQSRLDDLKLLSQHWPLAISLRDVIFLDGDSTIWEYILGVAIFVPSWTH